MLVLTSPVRGEVLNDPAAFGPLLCHVRKPSPLGENQITNLVAASRSPRESIRDFFGGASTVKVERRHEQYLYGAQRAIKSRSD